MDIVLPVIPAKAGIQAFRWASWMPAQTGMTEKRRRKSGGMRSRLMAKNVSRPAAGLALSLALLSGCASAEGREFARGLLEGMAEASSTMAAMKGGKYAQYAQYAPIAQAAAQMFEPIPDLPRFQEEPEVPLGEIPEAVAPMAHGASSFRRAGMGRFTLQDVETIVGRLATANGLPRHPVSVISNPEPNAGAGGGRITVHTGFLDDVQNEHEIALVLGHEIAHNVLRHMETLPDHAAVARLLHRTNLNESILKGNTRLIVHAISGAIEGHTRETRNARLTPTERDTPLRPGSTRLQEPPGIGGGWLRYRANWMKSPTSGGICPNWSPRWQQPGAIEPVLTPTKQGHRTIETRQ